MNYPTRLALLLALISFFIFPEIVFPQYADADKKIEKANKLAENNKPEEAEKVLEEAAKKYPSYGKVWDALADVQNTIYQDEKKQDNWFANGVVTAKDKNGNVIDDTLAQQLQKMLSSIKPSDTYLRHMTNTFRLACTQTREAYNPSMLLRIYKVDGNPNKDVKDDAWKEFESAEAEFRKKNFNSAANYYQKAIDLDSTFYKARLYLGDVYYFTKRYDLAITQFKNAVATRPDMLEPRKYLFDALDKSQAYDRAYDVGVDAVITYPDYTMMEKLEELAPKAGYKLDMHWVARDVLPNTMHEIESEKNDIKLNMPGKSPWKFYQQAMDKVKPYCTDKGLIGDNKVTTEKYLEVYSWKYMLDKASPDEFKFARKMMQKGMLDCYVFISCFHYDFYDQYLDFVANNKQHIKDYFAMLKEGK